MKIGMLIFPDMTLLDFAGPYEVFAKFPQAALSIVAKSLEAVAANGGVRVMPDATFDCPPVDLLFVPGGPGIGAVLEEPETLAFVRTQGLQARYVTSVCTGALILGASGLLQGYRAGTHWMSLDLLAPFGATAVSERVVTDRNRITGGGVTAGIDFALTLAAQLFGEAFAKALQLGIEYDPKPPFNSGHPDVADAELVANVRNSRTALQAQRLEQVKKAAALYCG